METLNKKVLLLLWPRLKSEIMTMMCWYDTFLSPYWIFMLHRNSDLQRASVESHVSLTRPAFSEHTLRNCYGNWLLWVIWHHHTLIWKGERDLHNKSQECKQGTQSIILISCMNWGTVLKSWENVWLQARSHNGCWDFLRLFLPFICLPLRDLFQLLVHNR